MILFASIYIEKRKKSWKFATYILMNPS